MTILRRLAWTSALLHPFLIKTLCFSTRIFHPKPFLPSSQIVSNETKAILFNKASLAPVQNSTQLMEQIDTFYIPLFENLYRKCQICRDNRASGTVYIGISAPQGCGKTTLTEYMKLMFESAGWSCLTISIDDFYLTHAEQNEVAASHRSNPLLQFRGNGTIYLFCIYLDFNYYFLFIYLLFMHPFIRSFVSMYLCIYVSMYVAGTHDVRLLLSTLKGAAEVRAGEQMYVPQYDKSLHSGRGDRAPFGRWLTATGPVDVVILEGWMLGFTPLPLTLSLPLTDVSPTGPSVAGRIKRASLDAITKQVGMEVSHREIYLFDNTIIRLLKY